tara:strand:- start:8 stop:136 length:129 start_codon:yes stop_codon:yes gene_type:complete
MENTIEENEKLTKEVEESAYTPRTYDSLTLAFKKAQFNVVRS